jgi:hypothetical protein
MARAWLLAELTRGRRNFHFSSSTLKLFLLSLQPLTAKALFDLPVREISLVRKGLAAHGSNLPRHGIKLEKQNLLRSSFRKSGRRRKIGFVP